MNQNKHWIFLLLLAGATACIDNPVDLKPEVEEKIVQETHELGETEFLTAEASFNDEYDNVNNAVAESDDASGNSGDERVAEEGDIYRVSQSEGIILNLNPYRGLQLIDFSDATSPKIIGSAQISGEPQEMYQVGNYVYVLMNKWTGYYANQSLGLTGQYSGGVIAVVDISDHANPVIIKRTQVPGQISNSRLTRGNGKESLYVTFDGLASAHSFVRSFSVSVGGELTQKHEVELGGNISHIQATGSHLLVSGDSYDDQGNYINNVGSSISVIDISDENGLMVEGASVFVQGRVSKKSDMSFRGNILRVVSGNSWNANTNTNHIETFNFSDLQNPTPVDGKTFGDGEDLFATLFLGNAAFFVTYLQVDPFHAFSISDDGDLVEESEFIVSGFNTWFRPVSDNKRLIGIGINDENGDRVPAVSLYDIEDLKNTNPLVDREEVTSAWSDAIWDDKTFSVLEKSANVMSDTGVVETGLVLLPFQGWDESSETYRAGVQIFTFSDTTLSKRGVMLHDTPVTRTFTADRTKDLTGNLSNLEFSLYNTSDVDAPTEMSRLELAPNYTKVLAFGDHIARQTDRTAHWSWWGSNVKSPSFDTIQIVPKADADQTLAIAEITIPSGSSIHKKDDLLIVVFQDATEAVVSSWDLSDPTTPVLKDTLTTDTIPVSDQQYYGGYYDDYDCYDCGGGVIQPVANVVGNALVFQVNKNESEEIGTQVTTVYRKDTYEKECSSVFDKPCTYIQGERSCSYVERTNGTRTPTICEEYFASCTQNSDDFGCRDIPDPSHIKATIETFENTLTRQWTQRDFHVVDLSDADDLKIRNVIVSSNSEEAVSTLQKDNLLYFTFKKSRTVSNSSRNLAAYYFRSFDFSDPENVVRSTDINVPGTLVAVKGDQIITQGSLWGVYGAHDTVNKLELVNGKAKLRGIKRYNNGSTHGKIVLSSDDHLYVPVYGESGSELEIFSITGAFSPISTIDSLDWLSLEDVIDNRAIFSTSGGVLIVNTADLENTYAQAFLSMRGWSTDFLSDGNELTIAAGRYGIYQFDITTSNLPQP